ncbi:hypothetical protein [Streptomyces zagrosensis]|uniref:Uncharacterized protein n=1 Tax=Streptomyces zagrosensis TaxID=1042984 RepID=A0A7W9QFH6_9ACTN|nr:hypothetical protein [Streptomyces zagrosensis]MBB5939034.1 hypothetical protein [Streptomyces zagrosensis]
MDETRELTEDEVNDLLDGDDRDAGGEDDNDALTSGRDYSVPLSCRSLPCQCVLVGS